MQRRQQPTKRWKKSPARNLFSNPLTAVVVVLLLVLIVIVAKNGIGGASGDNYVKGVYVNTVDLSAYTQSEGEKLIADWADSLTRATYTLVYDSYSYSFTPSDVNAKINVSEIMQKAWNLGHTGSASEQSRMRASLESTPQSLWTELTYDEEKLDAFIETIYNDVYLAPKDADILITADKPVILSNSEDGRALDAESLKRTLVSIMTVGGDAKTIPLPVELKEANVSTDDAATALQVITTYSTDTSESSSARTGNVRLALNNFNGTAVAPGEEISFNDIVGERSVLRGYVEAPVYYGASVTRGIGGGVCQASSTLYGAVLHAGMDVVERHNHTLIVAYCEASMDAAVSEDAQQNMRFVNNTEHTIYLFTKVTKEKATVTIYGNRPEYRIELISTILQDNIKNPDIWTVKDESGIYAYYTDEYRLKATGKLGRKSKLERVYYDWDTGEEVKREEISSDYYMGERDTYYVGVHPIGQGTQ